MKEEGGQDQEISLTYLSVFSCWVFFPFFLNLIVVGPPCQERIVGVMADMHTHIPASPLSNVDELHDDSSIFTPASGTVCLYLSVS